MKKIITAVLLALPLLSFSQNKLKDFKLTRTYDVEIVRDSFGVPHIFGKTDADVAFGLVYAACEDDFNTVQWGLLVAKGKLGMHLGIDGAKIDYAVQLLRVPEIIREKYEKDVSPEFKKLLEAAADAGNLYASQHPDQVLVKSAVPVEPQDFIAGYMLSQALMTGIDGALNSMVNGTVPTVPFAEHSRGSNGLAMNSKITVDGNVYLDINSHQPLEGPLSWYEAHLCSEEGWNIMGSTFHGAVTIFHGANENLGWAHTTNDFDAIDIYQLQPDPKHPKTHYIVDGKSYELEKGSAKLSVNLAKKGKFVLTIGKKIWWSMYGATIVNKKGIFAVRLASNMTIKAPEQWYRMNKAKNFTEFRHALDMQGVINQTIIYGDKYDTIYIISNGAMPKRADGYNWKGTVPGNTTKTLWTEFHKESDLPQVLNPMCGYVFNANNTAFQATCEAENPKPENYDKNIGYGKDEDNRSRRFYENISKYNKVSWNDFKTIKYDSQFPKKLWFFKKFDINDIMEMDENKYPEVADVISKFKKWDRSADVDDTSAAIVFKSLYQMYNTCNDSMERCYATQLQPKLDFFAVSMKVAKDDMLKHFGKLNIPLGSYQRHIRGDIDLPTDGGPDMWNAKVGNPYKDGKIKVWLGESYILLVKFKKDGENEYYSISPYGSSNTPGSKHYTDQMQMYVNHETKKMSLNKAYWYNHAEKIYTPGK